MLLVSFFTNPVIGKSDRSSKLFDSIVSALLSSYDDSQIITTQGKADCSKVLSFLGKMAVGGYLKGASENSKQFYAEISSQFMGSAGSAANAKSSGLTASAYMQSAVAVGAAAGIGDLATAAREGLHTAAAAAGPRWPFTATPTKSPSVGQTNVASQALSKNSEEAAKGITDGTLLTMVEGQKPVAVVSDNIRATMVNALVSEQKNANLAPAQTDAEKAYSTPQPKFVFIGNALERCNFPGGYSQLSTTNYGSNPHPGSDAVKSPLLGVGSVATTKVAKVGRRLSSAGELTAAAVAAGGAKKANSTTGVPLYYIILQFATKQTFNRSAIASGQRNANFTIPSCTLYNGKKYTSCGNCNISSFTDSNVTYGCFDMKNICDSPAPSTKKRRLASQQVDLSRAVHDGVDGVDGASEWDIPHYISPYASPATKHYHALGLLRPGDEEDLGFEGLEGVVEVDGVLRRRLDTDGDGDEQEQRSLLYHGSRRLQADDADDGGASDAASSDGDFSASSSASGAQIAMLLEAIAAELLAVLSSDPFANFDLSKATPVLAFVGCMIGSILLGLAFFLKWDKLERHQQVYLGEYRSMVHRENIQQDLLNGGSGLPHDVTNMFSILDKVTGRVVNAIKPNKANAAVAPTDDLPVKDLDGRSALGIRGGASGGAGAAMETTATTASEDASRAAAGAGSDSAQPAVRFLDKVDLPETDVEKSSWEARGLKMGPMTLAVLIAEFSNEMISQDVSMKHEKAKTDILDRQKNKPTPHSTSETLHTLQYKHYVTAPFVGNPSLRMTRTIRFVEMFKVFLCGIFVDTLIFGIFFPADGSCNNWPNRKLCELMPSQVIEGAKMCTWDPIEKACAPTPPPGSVVFLLIIAFIILVMGKPFDIGMTLILEEICCKRPTFDKWFGPKLHMDNWFGSVYHKR